MKPNLRPALLAVLAILCTLAANVARADNDFIVYSPNVVQGQSEIEAYGFSSRDARSSLNGASGYNLSVAHTFTSRWKSEVYFGSFNRDPGDESRLSGQEFENTFQLTDPGEFWADAGLLASYEYSRLPNVPDSVEFGPLFEKLSGHFEQRLNLIWKRPLGANASNEFRSAYRISYRINYGSAVLAPGIEAYYRPGDNATQLGPVLYGEFRSMAGDELEYSIGEVFGTNRGAPAGTLLARVEYGFF